MEGRGLCFAHLELRDDPDIKDKVRGYAAIICVPAGGLSPRGGIVKNALNHTDPEAATLSGAVENDTVPLQVEKIVGADADGCEIGGVTLTPFGNNKLAVEWTEPTCAGGHFIAQKMRGPQ